MKQERFGRTGDRPPVWIVRSTAASLCSRIIVVRLGADSAAAAAAQSGISELGINRNQQMAFFLFIYRHISFWID